MHRIVMAVTFILFETAMILLGLLLCIILIFQVIAILN